MLKNTLLTLCTLAGTGFLTSCQHNTLNIQVIPGFNKPMPMVKKGDILTWTTADAKPMPVTFTPFSPCEEGDGKPTPTCHVNVDGGLFPYTCEQCDDPVVPVGSSINDMLHPGAQTVVRTANPAYVGVYCDPKTNTAAAVPETASKGGQFQWIPAGVNPPTNWLVTLPTGTCQGSDQFGTGKGLKCTVASTAVSTPYKVHIEGCKVPDGTAQLTVQ